MYNSWMDKWIDIFIKERMEEFIDKLMEDCVMNRFKKMKG